MSATLLLLARTDLAGPRRRSRLLPGCMTEKPAVEATGVPVGAGVDVPPGSNEDFIVNVGRRIYFDESSADVNDTARVTLRKQAEWLSRHARYKIKIEGFADDRGSPDTPRPRAAARRRRPRLSGLARDRRGAHAHQDLRVREGAARARLQRRLVQAQNRRVVTVLETETGI